MSLSTELRRTWQNLIYIHYRYTIPQTTITVTLTIGRFTNHAHVNYTMPAYIHRAERARLVPTLEPGPSRIWNSYRARWN